MACEAENAAEQTVKFCSAYPVVCAVIVIAPFVPEAIPVLAF